MRISVEKAPEVEANLSPAVVGPAATGGVRVRRRGRGKSNRNRIHPPPLIDDKLSNREKVIIVRQFYHHLAYTELLVRSGQTFC